MSDETVSHRPLPKDTHAFICANCGAVSLDPKSICKVQGRGQKGDWCGSPSIVEPKNCVNRVNNLRFKCRNCNRVSVNPELLCEPEKMPEPAE